MTEALKDFLAGMFVVGMLAIITILAIRTAEPERHPDSAILIDEPDFHQTSAIICNRAIPPRVRPQKGVTFA